MDEQCVLQAVAAYTQSLQRDVASCHNLSAAAKHARSTIQRRVRENRARHPRRILRETQTYRTAAQGMQAMFSQIGDVESANKLAGLIPMIQRDIEADKRAVAALDEDEQALQVAQHVVNDRGEDLEKGEQLFRLFFAQLNEQQGGGVQRPPQQRPLAGGGAVAGMGSAVFASQPQHAQSTGAGAGAGSSVGAGVAAVASLIGAGVGAAAYLSGAGSLQLGQEAAPPHSASSVSSKKRRRAEQRCRCGAQDHVRITSTACPLNKTNHPT